MNEICVFVTVIIIAGIVLYYALYYGVFPELEEKNKWQHTVCVYTEIKENVYEVQRRPFRFYLPSCDHSRR